MPKYTLLFGSHSHGGRTYYKNDEIELSKEQMERFGGKERFGPAKKTSGEGEEITIPDLLEQSVPDIEAELANVNDVAMLDAVNAEEKKGEQRVGVFKAIEARKKALKG